MMNASVTITKIENGFLLNACTETPMKETTYACAAYETRQIFAEDIPAVALALQDVFVGEVEVE